MAAVFTVFCLINFICFQSIYQFNTYTRPVAAVLIILCCFTYWWMRNNIAEGSSWASVADNWIVTGMLLYFSSTMFLFIFSNQLMSYFSRAANVFIWNLHAVIVLLMYLLFALGFYKRKQ